MPADMPDELPDDTVPIAVHDYPAEWSAARTDTLRTAVADQSKIDIAVEGVKASGLCHDFRPLPRRSMACSQTLT